MINQSNRQPSASEVKEFWQWCGFKQVTDNRKGYHWVSGFRYSNWIRPNGETSYGAIHTQKGHLPPIDLNSLYRWAVPKVFTVGRGTLLKLEAEPYQGRNSSVKDGEVQWAAYTSERGYVSGDWFAWRGSHSEDPALALFWALFKVMKEE